MVQGARQSRLAQEALRQLGIVEMDRGQFLQSHVPTEHRIARQMHDRHAAAADQALDLVAAGLGLGGRHGVPSQR